MVRLHDVVALIEDLPGQSLERGQVGTVVGLHKRDLFEVEFRDAGGRVYAAAALPIQQFLVLRNTPPARFACQAA